MVYFSLTVISKGQLIRSHLHYFLGQCLVWLYFSVMICDKREKTWWLCVLLSMSLDFVNMLPYKTTKKPLQSLLSRFKLRFMFYIWNRAVYILFFLGVPFSATTSLFYFLAITSDNIKYHCEVPILSNIH